MILGVFIRIPIGPVPVVMTNLFILLAGYLTGPGPGCSAVGLYLLLGVAGLPVFSAGGGAALFLGPTGGYLAGYIPACLITGFLAKNIKNRSFLKDIIIFTIGALTIYIPGVAWLKIQSGLSWSAAAEAGMIPFLPGDILKIVAAASIIRSLEKSIPELFPVFQDSEKI